MKTVRTRLFRTNRSQAVRLPKDVEMPPGVSDVVITAVGQSRVVSPADLSWDAWFAGPTVDADFMPEREQPGHQDREQF